MLFQESRKALLVTIKRLVLPMYDNEFQRQKKKNELIGIVTATISAIFMVLCKLYRMPALMIPGFVFWAFSAGFTALNIYKALQSGHRMFYIRVILMLILAILMLLFITPAQ